MGKFTKNVEKGKEKVNRAIGTNVFITAQQKADMRVYDCRRVLAEAERGLHRLQDPRGGSTSIQEAKVAIKAQEILKTLTDGWGRFNLGDVTTLEEEYHSMKQQYEDLRTGLGALAGVFKENDTSLNGK